MPVNHNPVRYKTIHHEYVTCALHNLYRRSGKDIQSIHGGTRVHQTWHRRHDADHEQGVLCCSGLASIILLSQKSVPSNHNLFRDYVRFQNRCHVGTLGAFLICRRFSIYHPTLSSLQSGGSIEKTSITSLHVRNTQGIQPNNAFRNQTPCG